MFNWLKIFGLVSVLCLLAGNCLFVKAQTNSNQAGKNSLVNVQQRDLTELRQRGFAFLQKGDWSEAHKVFEEILTQTKNDPLTFYGNALALFNLKRVSEAENNCDSAIEILTKTNENPANLVDSLVLSAVISATKDKTGEAIEKLKRAIKLGPKHFDANFSLGRAYFGNGDVGNAVKSFRQAVLIQPENLRARYFLASALERDGAMEEALAEYRAAVKLNPNFAEGNLGLGVLLLKLEGDSSVEGIEALQKALLLNPNLYEARINLGKTFIRLNRPAEALEHLQKAAELAPKNPEPHYQLALAYRKTGKPKEAAEQLRIVKKIHESRRQATEN